MNSHFAALRRALLILIVSLIVFFREKLLECGLDFVPDDQIPIFVGIGLLALSVLYAVASWGESKGGSS